MLTVKTRNRFELQHAGSLEDKAIHLAERVLDLRQATTGISANLLDETIAYQLVWPD